MALPDPTFVYSEEVLATVDRSDFRTGGAVVRGQRHEMLVTRHLLEWKGIDLDEKLQIENDYVSRRNIKSFSFTPPDYASSVTVYYVDDTFQWEWVSGNSVNVSLTVEEEIDSDL